MEGKKGNNSCICYLAVAEMQYTVTVSEKLLMSFCKSDTSLIFRLYVGDVFKSLNL